MVDDQRRIDKYAEAVASQHYDMSRLARLRVANAVMAVADEEMRSRMVWRDITAAKLLQMEKDFPCDGGCVEAPEEDCTRHGRKPADLWKIINEMNEQIVSMQERDRRLAHGVWGEALVERAAAHIKHGSKSMESGPWTDPRRLRILLEEVGEVAKEFNDADIEDRDPDPARVRKELVQVTAMAGAWADAVPKDEGAPAVIPAPDVLRCGRCWRNLSTPEHGQKWHDVFADGSMRCYAPEGARGDKEYTSTRVVLDTPERSARLHEVVNADFDGRTDGLER